MNVDHLLKQSCSINNIAYKDKFGGTSLQGAVDTLCRFQQTTKVISTPQRERDPIDGLVWLPAGTVVGIGDKLTFDSKGYRVMRIEPIVDGRGVTRHLELMVQNWNN